MKFSLLIPSRGRPSLLRDFMRSVASTADKLSDVEFLIKIDEDDDSEYDKMLNENFKTINYRLFVEKRSYNLSDDYYNYLAKRSSGDYLWILNDDCILGTPHWDTSILELDKKNQINGRIFYLGVAVSGTSIEQFSPFAMITRTTFEVLGYVQHPMVRNWDGDVVLWNIFKKLEDFNIVRIVKASEVGIFHINGYGDIGDSTHNEMKQSHMRDGGYNGSLFSSSGLYDIECKKMRMAIDCGK